MLNVVRTLGVLLLLTACSSDSESTGAAHGGSSHRDGGAAPGDRSAASWQTVFMDLPGGLFSVWGGSERDVWLSGSDTEDGRGPLVLHYDGSAWQRLIATRSGDLWWAHGFASGVVFFGGSNGVILRYDGARFARVPTPKTIGTVFGIWGSTESDVWAVGGDVLYGTGAFVWRYAGDRFDTVENLPVPASDVVAYFKVWGTSATDVWIVGTPGLSVHFDGSGLERVDPNVTDPLFTVHARPAGDLVAAVGGADLGVLVERGASSPWAPAAVPSGTRTLFGVWLTPTGGYAVGDDATVLSRSSGAWAVEPTGLAFDKALHSVWVDPQGGVWAVGGDVLVPPYGAGALIHYGPQIPTTYVVESTPRDAAVDQDARADAAGTRDARPPPKDATPDRTELSDAARDAAARDARPESAPPPKKVACGATACSLPAETCCADENTGVGVGCIASGTPCPTGQAPVFCDEPSDCGPGFACCLNRLAQVGPLQNVDCEPSCFGPSVCASDADCAGQPCKTFAVMPSYETCPPPPAQ